MEGRHILIAGAVTNDWLTFQQPDDRDLSRDPWRDRTTGVVVRRGGAAMVTELLRQGMRAGGYQVFGPSSGQLEKSPSSELVHAILDMIPAFPGNHELSAVAFRVERLRRIANQKSFWHSPSIRPGEAMGQEVVTLVDSSNGFKDMQDGIKWLHSTRPRYLVYKMARPLVRRYRLSSLYLIYLKGKSARHAPELNVLLLVTPPTCHKGPR